MTQKPEYVAEVPVDNVYEDLTDLEKALFGLLVGAAGSMNVDTVGIDIQQTIDYLKDVAPGMTPTDLMAALDRLQQVKVTAPYDGGTITTCMVSVLAYISDADGVRKAINVAVPFRGID